jgi:5-methylcytosine-specific restriction endonuclease McrA
MTTGLCKQCGDVIVRRGSRTPVFCSVSCKASWQRNQKPINRDELKRLYVDRKLGTYAISRIVKRNPKRIYEWLCGYGIPLRSRKWSTERATKPYHDLNWLTEQYVIKKRSAAEIAREFKVDENTILFFLQRLQIPRRTTSQVRAYKRWGCLGKDNPMFGRTGASNPHWKGGVTPERQAFYLSKQWNRACAEVWKRDKATCQRCRRTSRSDSTLHVHHLASFAIRRLRAEPSNLVLLCRKCHHFVHSSRNARKEFIASAPTTSPLAVESVHKTTNSSNQPPHIAIANR